MGVSCCTDLKSAATMLEQNTNNCTFLPSSINSTDQMKFDISYLLINIFCENIRARSVLIFGLSANVSVWSIWGSNFIVISFHHDLYGKISFLSFFNKWFLSSWRVKNFIKTICNNLFHKMGKTWSIQTTIRFCLFKFVVPNLHFKVERGNF